MVRCFEPMPVKVSPVVRFINALKRRNGKKSKCTAEEIIQKDVDTSVEADATKDSENIELIGANQAKLIDPRVEHYEPLDRLDMVRCFPPVAEPPSRIQKLKQSLRN